jgi:lysophospholipase L1-like esterase
MRAPLSLLSFVATLALICPAASAATPAAPAPVAASLPLPPAIAQARRIVVLGDSITYAGGYVDFVETVLRTRVPGWRGEIIDVGLSSETVSGLSEEGHAGGKFPRPDLHERLERVLTQLKPDLVLACYGMNDGIYHPFAEERFAKFRDGMTWLHDTVIAAQARIIHLTPPIFDPQPIAAKTLPPGLIAYPQPYAGYNDVLDRYSSWLVAQRAKGWEVIDLHSLMAANLARMRETNPKFSFSKDGIHPDAFGHAVMARAILTAWNLHPDQDELLTRLSTDSDNDLFKLVRERRKLLENAWLTATGHKRPGVTPGLPLPEAETKAAAITEKIRALK